MYVDYDKTLNGNDFSIWQRSSQLSAWIPTNIELKQGESKKVYVGELEITDEIKTITVRKRKKDTETSVRIYAFEFEKIRL